MRTTVILAAAAAAAVLVASGFPGRSRAQVFDETTLTFSFADDNVLRDPGETRRNSPDAYFGQQAISSLDRIEDSAYRQTQSRLVLSKKLDTGDFYPEGSLRMRFGPGSYGDYVFADDGTYLKLNYVPSPSLAGALTFYPIDSDKFRLGYHYDITWGGTNVFPKNFRRGLVPGVKLSVDSDWLGFYIGAKTALIRSPTEVELDNPGGNTNQFVERAYYGFLGGARFGPFGGFQIDASGGFFEKGTNTRSAVLGKSITAGGGSLQLSFKTGGEVGRRLDLRLYQEAPEQYPLEAGTDYKGDFGFEVALEGAWLIQTLEDPDHANSTKNENARAACLSAGVRIDKFRAHVTGVYRELSYIVYNVPGFVPYQALPDAADMAPELFAVVSFDYFIESLNLTPALSAGVLMPATYSPSMEGSKYEGPFADEVAQGIQKVVVRGSNSGDWDILPPGEDRLQVGFIKLDLKYTLADSFHIIGEIMYGNDRNLAQVELDEHGHAVREFLDPHILSFGVITEMSF